MGYQALLAWSRWKVFELAFVDYAGLSRITLEILQVTTLPLTEALTPEIDTTAALL